MTKLSHDRDKKLCLGHLEKGSVKPRKLKLLFMGLAQYREYFIPWCRWESSSLPLMSPLTPYSRLETSRLYKEHRQWVQKKTSTSLCLLMTL